MKGNYHAVSAHRMHLLSTSRTQILNYINHPTLGSHVIFFPACVLWVQALLILWVSAVLFPTIEGEIPEGGILQLEVKMIASLWATGVWAWYS